MSAPSTASVDKQGQKWVNTGVALTCLLLFYVLVVFFNQLNEWFELEAKVQYFTAIAQATAAILSLGTFIAILKHPVSSSFLREAYAEMVKVVFPDKNETMGMTVRVMIMVTIIGFVLGFFDWGAGYLLSLLPQM